MQNKTTPITTEDILTRIKRVKLITTYLDEATGYIVAAPALADDATKKIRGDAEDIEWKLTAASELTRQISYQEDGDGWNLEKVREALCDVQSVLTKLTWQLDRDTMARCMASENYLNAVLKGNIAELKTFLMREVIAWETTLIGMAQDIQVRSLSGCASRGMSVDTALARLNTDPDIIRYSITHDMTEFLPGVYILADQYDAEYLYVTGTGAWSRGQQCGDIYIRSVIRALEGDDLLF